MPIYSKEQIVNLLQELTPDSFRWLSDQEAFLDALESYECWTPLTQLLEGTQDKKKSLLITRKSRLAKIYNLYLFNKADAIKTCRSILETTSIDFSEFCQTVFPKVLGQNDTQNAFEILFGIYEHFKKNSDKILCLERLCFLADKHLHRADILEVLFVKVLELDPGNKKALRFFKHLYTQNKKWEDAANVLLALLRSNDRRVERNRYGQELAMVYLYQLDLPEKCLDALSKYCKEDILNNAEIAYDAYQRLSDLPGCIRVLEDCLDRISTNTHKAIILYRQASLYQSMEDFGNALAKAEASLALKTDFLEAYELVVQLHLSRKDWTSVQAALTKLQQQLSDDTLASKIQEAQDRLTKALQPI